MVEEEWVCMEKIGFSSYEISTKGRIKSYRKSKGGKIMIPHPNKSGYLNVVLVNDLGERRTKAVHKLVAIIFMDHKPNGMVDTIDHIDNNKLNNNTENLQVLSGDKNTRKKICSHKTSKYLGVHWSERDDCWRTEVGIGDTSVSLGSWSSEEDARDMYEGARKICEENYPNHNLSLDLVLKYRDDVFLKKIRRGKFGSIREKNGRFYARKSFRINGKKTEKGLGGFNTMEEAVNSLIKYKKNINNGTS